MFPGTLYYLIIAVLGVFDLIWIVTRKVTVQPDTVAQALIVILPAAALILFYRHLSVRLATTMPAASRAGFDRLSRTMRAMLEGMFFISVMDIAVGLFNYALMNLIHRPYRDGWLMHLDQAAGLDWNAYFAYVAGRVWLAGLSTLIYTTLWPVGIIGFIGLVAADRLRAAEFLLAGIFVTVLPCLLIGAFVPAQGAIEFMLRNQGLLHAFATLPGQQQVAPLAMLRGGGNVTLRLGEMPGLISFPSFHAACGVIFAWSLRRTKGFWPMTLYAFAMIATTPVLGAHYFVDIVAGLGLAIIMLTLLERLPRYREAFGNRNDLKLIN